MKTRRGPGSLKESDRHSDTGVAPGKKSRSGLRYGAVQSQGPVQLKAAGANAKEYNDPGELTAKDSSARFEDDPGLETVAGGTEVGRGGRGLTVTKIQQALIDMGYLLPKYGVDGKFETETASALIKFQQNEGIPQTGKLDSLTLKHFHDHFDTRQPYINNAKFDPANPDAGTRNLSATDQTAAVDAMEPQRGVGNQPAKFEDEVAGKHYGPEIQAQLAAIIAGLHKELYEDKVDLRKDPKKNFHDWSVLEGTALASKEVTDTIYGSYAQGPEMTAAAGNFVDQWTDEEARNAGLSPGQKQAKARNKVVYLINSNCADINQRHSAVPSDTNEKAILTPIIASFVDSDAKVDKLLEIDMGWEGAQLEGTVYLQRYKSPDAGKNRTQLWEIFHTCIHEYLHSLAHTDYKNYAGSLGDATRYNTLIEGFCDFFTLNVRSTVTVTPALRSKVEGPYYDKTVAAPNIRSGVYPSHRQAEQVVSIVGIRNAQAAYFKGDVEKIGGSKVAP